MCRHMIEKSQLKRYNKDILYTIGGIKMDRITQSMLDAFQHDLSLNFNDSTLLFEYFSNNYNWKRHTRNRWDCNNCKSETCKYH